MSKQIDEVSLSEISENYANLRIVNPRAEANIARSIRLFGQMSPVVCVKTGNAFELIDGFKRVRACRKLDHKVIKAVLLETTVKACKASIIQLNKVSKSITDLEEALVLQSLHREEGLSQVEIGTLLQRDKSWVSRRISLIEKLADEVREHIELGLISVSAGREIARLPRGNQPEVLKTVLKHRLGKREVEKMVRILLSKPTSSWAAILCNVWDYLRSPAPEKALTHLSFSKKLKEFHILQEKILSEASALFSVNSDKPSSSLLNTVIQSTSRMEKLLKNLLSGTQIKEPYETNISQ